MEELLSRIQNKQITDYMREALGCYSTGAYRACIVLCYIALFEDLRDKLLHLAALNSTAKAISIEVEQRAKDQQIYEKYMVDQLKAVGLVTEVEAFRLEQVRLLRNKAAHPSGLHPSPEEARYVYFETIDKFLAQQVLKTTHAVDNLITRLKNDNFFPSSNVDEVAAIVSGELSTIHPATMPYLVKKLVEAIESAETTFVRNADRFFSGLAVRDDSETNSLIRQKLLTVKADDSSKKSLLMTVLSLNPKLLDELDETTFLRLRSLAVNELETEKVKPVTKVSHPLVLLKNLLEKRGEDYVEQRFPAYWSVISELWYSGVVLKVAMRTPKAHAMIVSTWRQMAGSSSFDTANSFATQATQLDSFFAQLEPHEALDLALQICVAAQRNAFDAISLRDQRFSQTPALAMLARKSLDQDPQGAEDMVRAALNISSPSFAQKYLPMEEEGTVG